MSASQLKRSAVGLTFAIGLSFAGWQHPLAQAEPPTPEYAKELYFDAARAGRVDYTYVSGAAHDAAPALLLGPGGLRRLRGRARVRHVEGRHESPGDTRRRVAHRQRQVGRHRR